MCLPLLVICALLTHSFSSVSELNLYDVSVPTVVPSGIPNGAEIGFGFSLTQHALPNGTNV